MSDLNITEQAATNTLLQYRVDSLYTFMHDRTPIIGKLMANNLQIWHVFLESKIRKLPPVHKFIHVQMRQSS